jgi:hypothetical protein
MTKLIFTSRNFTNAPKSAETQNCRHTIFLNSHYRISCLVHGSLLVIPPPNTNETVASQGNFFVSCREPKRDHTNMSQNCLVNLLVTMTIRIMCKCFITFRGNSFDPNCHTFKYVCTSLSFQSDILGWILYIHVLCW